MADKFEIEEDREILSVVNDQLDLYGLKLKQLTDETIDQYVNGILDGSMLLQGQIVFLKSTDTLNVLGMIPAIVTDIKRLTANILEYTMLLLTGNLDGELVPVKFTDDKLADAITIEEDMANVITAIKTTKLGSATYINLKEALNITRFYVVDIQTSKLKSFM